MCGIVAAVADRNIVPVLIEGLRKLEYRGYDSAGIALVCNDHVEVAKKAGKLANLAGELEADAGAPLLPADEALAGASLDAAAAGAAGQEAGVGEQVRRVGVVGRERRRRDA